ncbi:MAG: sulfatase-like hydrolase/transferase [Candidatus Thiodiazotropha sp.]
MVELLIVSLFSKNKVTQNIILSGFVTINILYLNLVLNSVFNKTPNYGQILALLLAMFIVFSFFNMQDDSPLIAKVLPVCFALATVVVFGQTLHVGNSVTKELSEHRKSTAKNIRLVDFNTKPNVYFIAFDSLIPKSLLQKFLGVKKTDYHEVLEANFKRFNNFFADYPTTKPSLNSLLALDVDYYNEAASNESEYNFFPGLTPSPLFEVFKHNGYESTVYHKSFYFGAEKGQYVDNYFVNHQVYHSALCEFIDLHSWRALTFMGYCRLQKSQKIQKLLNGLGFIDTDVDILIDYMRAGLKKEKPQIFVAYIWSPGHTLSSSYNVINDGSVEDFRETYLENSKITASHLIKIINFINTENPEAIVYIFGDHGPYTSRGLTFEDNKTLFVQDIFGVYGGIYPRDRCEEFFEMPYSGKFMTVRQGAHMIIRCLAGGKNAFIKPDVYQLPELIPKGQNSYENYLYE